jgi:hypothetical protein
MDFLLGEMSAEAHSVGAQLIILYIPHLTRKYFTTSGQNKKGTRRSVPRPPDVLVKSADKNNIILVDATPAVAEYYTNKENPALTVSSIDAHPNERAQILFADVLTEAIQKLQPLLTQSK